MRKFFGSTLGQVAMLVGGLALAGCTGEQGLKGDPGAAGTAGAAGATGGAGATGATGATGAAGKDAPVAMVEQCGGCHSGVAARHSGETNDAVGVTLTSIAVDSTTHNVTIKYNVKVNGVNRIDFMSRAQDLRAHNEDAFWVYDAVQLAGVREKIPCGTTVSASCTNPAVNWSIKANGSGNYTATISGFTADPVAGTVFMLSPMGPNELTATVVATLGTATHDVVGDAACINCHGNHIWRGAAHDVTNPVGVGPCVVCHNRVGSADPRIPGLGTGLMGIVHGVHNSEAMPEGKYTFTWTNGNKFDFTIGFPGYMNNCKTCHDTQARLDQVKNAPISYALCISCHGSMDGFGMSTAIRGIHNGITSATDCTTCHKASGGSSTKIAIGNFHNGRLTERSGVIWDGADQSVELGAKVDVQITGVTVDATNKKLNITWTAKFAGTAVDPCNTTATATAPVFFGLAADTATGAQASNMSVLRGYLQGDDIVNGITGVTSPGQPGSAPTVGGSSAATTCAANVATTVVALDNPAAATRGVVALQGKAQLLHTGSSKIVMVRSKSPAFFYKLADGSASPRRQVVDTAKCLDCHPGSLYQHGGNRIDNVELCDVCHNPASSDQNNRALMGVDATEAYDGRDGQSYDMRTMVHQLHASAEAKPLVIYRTRGIYFFGPKSQLPANWPTTGGVTCTGGEGLSTYYKVYGSKAYGKAVTVNADGTCNTSVDSTDGAWQPHIVTPVEYPRAINACGACHVAGSVDHVADPTKAVAVTAAAGAAPWDNLLDDTLQGPTAAACMSCHGSADSVKDFFMNQHAATFGIEPAVFDNGRQDLLDAAK